MNHLVRCICVVAFAAAPVRVSAQEPAPVPTPPTDTVRRAESLPAPAAAPRPAEPSADQQKYLRGIRTAARGVAQLKTGVERVTRAEATKDTTRLKAAGRMLAGLCGTARSFMAQGRPGMKPTVYEDSARVHARKLTLQIDSLLKAMPACETEAVKAPTRTAAGLLGRLKSYEAALQDFRTFVLAAPPVAIPPQKS